jgi:hypothetical protein
MLLNLRYEWRLKSIEKYALDSLMGAGWERVSTVGFPRKTVVGFCREGPHGAFGSANL